MGRAFAAPAQSCDLRVTIELYQLGLEENIACWRLIRRVYVTKSACFLVYEHSCRSFNTDTIILPRPYAGLFISRRHCMTCGRVAVAQRHGGRVVSRSVHSEADTAQLAVA